ncbi:hypothetical protein PHYPSEUDO_000383 [Phytophthora pseudosyringae]|uniref:Sulfatase N-terminal domain-containing protein n=1 Tax=Phytophthora pseudosyringae TaxID=221518 RepID=A0A8T1W1D9_9STRA|nr:hypothetical protein PHYPSEUDO_000383 [Phytophthora pseudosyringae]
MRDDAPQTKSKAPKAACPLARGPSAGWAFAYALVLLTFSVFRCTALASFLKMYGSADDGTTLVVTAALALGFLQDFVCATYFACALWLFDTFVKPRARRCFASHGQFSTNVLTFLASWTLFVAMMAPFVADVVVVRLREMRFTFDLVAMAIEEKDHADAMAVSSSQVTEACWNVTALVAVATFFAAVRTRRPWADLSSWNPTHMSCSASSLPPTYSALSPMTRQEADNAEPEPMETLSRRSMGKDENGAARTDNGSKYVAVAIQDDVRGLIETEAMKPMEYGDKPTSEGLSCRNDERMYNCCKYGKPYVVVLFGLVVFPVLVVELSCASSPLVAYSALNTTLNELLNHALQPTADENTAGNAWFEYFIDKSEVHSMLGNDTLYRRTKGFRGDLAFDVDVDDKDPPNVLVLVVEAFRHHDSHYLVGEEDPSKLFKGSNITITPSFDKWAKRGIALRNFWSSWRTSRSLESLLFGQIPFDSAIKSGTTKGQLKTRLAGLPQLFKAKNYETFFTTGCLTSYDGWDLFLPSHGFDTVWSRNEMKKLAESNLGINESDWDGPEHRGLNWGVHDDLSFQLLGDLMVNKTREQRDRVAKGEAKKPLFLNHYTISSHVDFKQRPKWYDEAQKPDFSALYDGEEYADNIKNYLEMRYFSDMEIGKFLDRMEEAGILNDTIIVIAGDHGQGPEFGNDVPEDRDVSATRVAGAIIAEGRLGDAAGLVIDDATEQYDMLNTLADMTGLPAGGFEQDGVGRSLKRKIKFGERIVYSNNPTRKMSVVRGYLRLRYERIAKYALLHNVDTDHDMKNDLLPASASSSPHGQPSAVLKIAVWTMIVPYPVSSKTPVNDVLPLARPARAKAKMTEWFRKLNRCWSALHMSYRGGQYSLERLLALDEYVQKTSKVRVALDPTAGWSANYGFWIRVAIFAMVIANGFMVQVKHFVQSCTISPRQLLGIVVFSAVLETPLAVVVSAFTAFPIPFSILTMAPSFYPILLSLFWAIIPSEVIRGMLRHPIHLGRYVKFTAALQLMAVAYPVYQTLFHYARDTSYQLPVMLLLPILKLVLKNIMFRCVTHMEDMMPEAVTFTVDFFNALYLTTNVESASSRSSVVIVVVIDIVQSFVVLYQLNQRTMSIMSSAKYHSELTGVTEDNIAGMVTPIFLFSLVEVVAFVLLASLLYRNLRVNGLYQVAFVLETHQELIRAKLLTWVLMTMAFRVVHFGIDFTFKFDWISK